MKHYFLVSWIVLMTLLLGGCSSSEDTSVLTPAYNEHVLGYTSGRVSRKASVSVVLSSDIPADQQTSKLAESVMSISPSVKGTYAFANGHTLSFTPTDEMKYDENYTVTVKLEKLFNDKSEDFRFGFRTVPFSISASSVSFDVDDDDKYIYDIVMRTSDDESLERISSLISCDYPGIIGVEKQALKSNEFLYRLKVNPTKEGTISVMAKSNDELKWKETEITNLDVLSSDRLAVFSVGYVTGDTKYVEVCFNKQLDSKQKMMGLAYIEGNTSKAVEVHGNKLRLFPDAGRLGEVKVHVTNDIRSKKGVKYNEHRIFNVDLKVEKPCVEFVNKGVIIPQNGQITVPFRSIFYRGVRVRVFKIYAQNVGMLLQQYGGLNEEEKLTLVGRPVAASTFYMDESNADLSQWNNYAVDLTNLFKAEPGALYRIELHEDYRLSTWPGADFPVVTKEELESEDKGVLASLESDFEDNNWYYMGGDWYYDDYDDDEYNDPAKRTYYSGRRTGKNVLATNIGLVAEAGEDNKMEVVATDLMDAKALSSVDITAYNKQMYPIAKASTNGDGRATLSFDNKNGQPYYLVAEKSGDVSYLRVKRGEEMSTSTFDVSGDVTQKGLKGYIYGERGVWRPGDTLHLGFMLNDRNKTLPENHPVVLELTNPLGQLYRKMTKSQGVLGTYSFNIPTEPTVPTGTWVATVTVGGARFQKYLRVETIKPNRLKIDLKVRGNYSPDNRDAKLHTEWLSGGTTHDLKYEIEASFSQTKTTFDSRKGFVFDDPSKRFSSFDEEIASGKTDSKGNAEITLRKVDPSSNNVPGFLRCALTTRVYEESGEFSTDVFSTTYSPYSCYVGIKAPTAGRGGYLPTGSNQVYELTTVDAEGKAQANEPLKVTVYKVQWYWWWNSSNSALADYVSSSYNKPVKEFEVTTDFKGMATLTLNFPDDEWGTYFIRVKHKDSWNHSTGLLSYYDWPTLTSPREMEGRDNALSLSLTTNAEEFHPGDKINVSFPSAAGGRAIVSVCNGSSVLDMKFVDCTSDRTSVTIDATEDMKPNVYLYVMLIQPYRQSMNDMPIRLYGVKPIFVNSEDSKLNPVIVSEDGARPISKYVVKVKEEKGRAMAYTLAVVDEGLLDLTRFKTPNAWDAFNAREALGVRQWDMYGLVAGAFGGRIEQMFSVGGDESLNGPKAIVNRFTPMVYFEGPFKLEKGKTNAHEISIPNYIGRVRVMVVAADGEAYGSAEKSVPVTKPLMVMGTMPRQIGVGDEMEVAATVMTGDRSIRNVKVDLSCTDGLEILGEKNGSLQFDSPGDQTVRFRVKVNKPIKVGTVSITATSGSEKAVYATNIDVRTVSQRVATSKYVEVKAGGNFNETVSAPGSTDQQINVEVSTTQPLNMSNRLKELMVYPHGCAEQTTSKAFPQLFLSEFTELSAEQKKDVDDNVKAAIDKMVNYQTADGGIAYWPNSMTANLWCSAYVLHFFNEASSKGYYVNDKMKKNLAKYVAKEVKNWKSGVSSYDTYVTAFSLFVLANSNAAELGVMNRMKESNVLSESDLALLASAYKLTGHKDVATSLMSRAGTGYCSYWCGKDPMILVAETLLEQSSKNNTAENVRKALVSDSWMSTSETALSLYAMSKYYKKAGADDGMTFNVTKDKQSFAKVDTKKYVWNATLSENEAKNSLQIDNKGKNTLFVTIAGEGVATQEPVPALTSGLKVSVSYSTDVSTLEQGTTFTAQVIIQNISGKDLENVAITHILPSGWETMSHKGDSYISYQDVRDDRVLSYIDYMPKGKTVVVNLTLSATYVGSYYMPSITAGCMYDNKITGCTASGECVVK